MALTRIFKDSIIKPTYKSYCRELNRLKKICKYSGGGFILLVESPHKDDYNTVLITRESHTVSIAKWLGSHKFKLKAIHRDIFHWKRDLTIAGAYENGPPKLEMKDRLATEILSTIHWNTTGQVKGCMWSNIKKIEDPFYLIPAVDFLIRSGILVKLPTGGIWLTEEYWNAVMQRGQMFWMSPMHYIAGGKITSKRKVYGKQARKNYHPEKMNDAFDDRKEHFQGLMRDDHKIKRMSEKTAIKA